MSLGGKTTETQSIDPDLKAAALANLQMAQRVGQLGSVPYKGATVAGMQPAQIGAMQNLNTGLEAFGFSGSPIPAAGDLSPYGIYQQQLAQMAPGQRAFIESMFINPVTGAAPTMQFGYQPPAPMAPTAPAAPAAPVERGGGGGAERAAAMAATSRAAGGGNRSTTSLATPASYLPGGVNTRNPGSLANRVVAAMAPAQGAPTAANRPVARAVATTNPSKATLESMAKAAAANAATRPVTVAASGGGSGSMSTAAANAAAANKAAEAKAAAEREARDRIAAAERDRAAANKAAEAKAAAERQARDRIAAAERDRAAANKAAAEKAKQDAAKGKGGKSGPSNSGSKSSVGSAGRR